VLQTTTTIVKQIVFPNLPLAVYREIAAHLRQIEGVSTCLIPQSSTDFNYYQSQVGSLKIEYNPNLDPKDLARLEEIINYYSKIYS
jgi:hypothetical protein